MIVSQGSLPGLAASISTPAQPKPCQNPWLHGDRLIDGEQDDNARGVERGWLASGGSKKKGKRTRGMDHSVVIAGGKRMRGLRGKGKKYSKS